MTIFARRRMIPFPHQLQVRDSSSYRDRMRRREFIIAIGAMITWPLAARSQGSSRVDHLGFLPLWTPSQAQPARIVAVQPYARPDSLASRNNLARSSQASRAPPWGISQPAFISCVCEGADKLALQSNFQGLLFNPRICPRRAGIHSGGN